ncbi:succinylglutamate desuccinylase/aspartoacylase family protein [Verrucomicrobiales bacterium BCK34]|nr:succinylglutamate desuccinylase/aspartoacylase family protein [Verrucomicrobiales bacterium BCK34]
MSESDILIIGGTSFKRRRKGVVDLPIGSLIDYQPVTMTVHVRRGKEAGPTLLLTAGIHGDEIIGMEVLRRMLKSRKLQNMKGDLIIVPVVCMPAFLSRTRYLPDRRDLNRLFPGSPEGSLGGRLAATFVQEIVPHCTHSIDFHAGAVGRPNLPQIRVTPGDSEAVEMAKAFDPPAIIESSVRDGSIRGHLAANKIPALLYEAGEAFRLDPSAIRYALHGIYGVMRHLGMLSELPRAKKHPRAKTVVSSTTKWIRASQGGIFTSQKGLGKAVVPGDKLGILADPFGRKETPVISDMEGIIIGLSCEGTADEGDALFHIASTKNAEKAEEHIQHSDAILEEHADPLH